MPKRPHAAESLDDAFLEDAGEIVDAASFLQPLAPAPATPPKLQAIESTDLSFASAQPANYAAVQFILKNNLRTQCIDSYLDECHTARSRKYHRHVGFTVTNDSLTVAGHVASSSMDASTVGSHARSIELSACAARCGNACTGKCRVGVAVCQLGSESDTWFYFGQHDEVLRCITTESIAVTFLADDLTLKHDRDVDAALDAYIANSELLERLRLKPVALASRSPRCSWLAAGRPA